MCLTTGTESWMASKGAKGPSTLAKGVRTPEASQIGTDGFTPPVRASRLYRAS